MSQHGRQLSGVAMAALAVIAFSGCSSWRYRGYLNEANQVGEVTASKAYRIESLSFDNFNLEVASGDGAFTQWIANKVYVPFYYDLSNSEVMNERSYIDDVTEATGGLCSDALDATKIRIRLTPYREVSRGSWSSLYPLFVTLGIVPSEKSCDVPFEIEVKFPDDKGVRKSAAALRIDSRFAFSPFGSVRYPQVEGVEACETVAGSFLFSERDQALRKAFVQTVANAVRLAIAEREQLQTTERPNVVYEPDEAPVEFQSSVAEDPIYTPGGHGGDSSTTDEDNAKAQNDFFN